MHPDERFTACLKNRPLDRLPYLEWWGPWDSTLHAWMRETGKTRSELLAYRQDFDAEAVTDIDIGFLPEFPPEIIRSDEQYTVRRDRMGLIYRVMTQEPDRSMPEFLEFPVKTEADWLALKPRLDPTLAQRYPAEWPQQVARWRRERPALRLTGYSHSVYWGFSLFGFCRLMLGDEEVLYAFYDSPRLVHDMLETITEFNIQLIQRALREAPITWVQIWEDMCYTSGPLISPAMFRSFLMPYYLRLTEAIRSTGVDLIMVDSDGDVAELIPLWLEAGVSGVYPMEQAAGNDLWAYRARYGSSLGMVGGIDKRVLAMDRAAIDRELELKIGLAMEGGYLPVHDHTIPTDVSYANYMYYLERKRKLIGLE